MSDDKSSVDRFANRFSETDDDANTDTDTDTDADTGSKQGSDTVESTGDESSSDGSSGELGFDGEENGVAPPVDVFEREDLVRLQFRVTEAQRKAVNDTSKLWELTEDGCDDVSRPEFQMAAVEVLMNHKDEWLSVVQDKYVNSQ